MTAMETESTPAALQPNGASIASPASPLATSTDLTVTSQENTLLNLASEGPETDASEVKKTKKIIRRKRRPARPQVDPSTLKSEPPPQTGTIFNIWYNKWSGGDREDKYLSKTAAQGPV